MNLCLVSSWRRQIFNTLLKEGTRFIDASKAFDRVRYDKLFELLLGRGIPHVAVRLLMDM